MNGSPFFIVFFPINGSKRAVGKRALRTVFCLTDHAVENLVAAPIGTLGIAEVEIINAAVPVSDNTRVAPNAIGARYFFLGPSHSAVGTLVKVVQNARGINVHGVGRVHADARFTDAAAEGRSFMNFYRLSECVKTAQQGAEEQGEKRKLA
jgi:hypothetical protein